MPRIPALKGNSAPEAAKPVLAQIKETFGRVPNIFATVANSPAALKALMGSFASLDEGVLAGKVHEALALRVGEAHGCRYCVAAHTAKAQMAGVSAEETVAFRKGETDDPKLNAMLAFAGAMVEKRGSVSDDELQALRDQGWTDNEIVEAIAIVALNTYTNYVNAVVQTKLDFPAAPAID